MRFSGSFLLIIFSALLLSSCSNTRFLKGDEVLYTGLKKITITDKENIKHNKEAKELIDAITFSKPNNALFGTRRILIPFSLWAHNYLKPKKEGKKGNWLYRTLGKEPVLISTVNPEMRSRKLETGLFSKGYFHATASHSIHPKKSNSRKAKISYTINLGQPFKINKIINPAPIDSIDMFINSYMENLKIAPGDIFNLDIIKAERQAMAGKLAEEGYYFFSPDYIEFIADTSLTPFQIDLTIRKNRELPEFVLKKYSIDEIQVQFTDMEIVSTRLSSELPDSTYYEGISIIGAKNYLKPEAIRRCIQFENGDLYSTSRHQGTNKQLNNTGVFRNVKMQFVLSDTLNKKVNLFIELSPKENVTLNLEGYVQTKSTGFAGPGVEATVSDGNIGRAANTLQLRLTGGFEWQTGKKSGEELGSNSYNAGINSAFVFPKFVLPFKADWEKNLMMSKTICDLGFEFLNNTRYYRMTSLTAGFGYQWKKRKKITNMFSPVRVNIVNLLETTKNFDSIVEGNIYVKKSFEEQTVLGMMYSFIYDNTVRKKNGTYFQAIIGTSGNFASLVSNLVGNEKPYKILNNVYSQFLKVSFDFRYYTRTVKKGFAFRLYTGTGYSYGNSTVMPYIEQFYSGGSTSIRGFTARSLGPGSYKPDEINGIIDQTGDIKLEFNAEYRVPFSETILGAFFFDVGNVWLLNEDEFRPGAEFNLNSFTKQLAVGSGIGSRFDFDFFILRTDLGIPMRNTYESENGYWLSNFSEMLSGYRFNIAIGYPF